MIEAVNLLSVFLGLEVVEEYFLLNTLFVNDMDQEFLNGEAFSYLLARSKAELGN